MLDWTELTSEDDIIKVINNSEDTLCLIFKHSNRCSLSFMAKDRLERKWKIPSDKIRTFYLDLVSYRNISSAVAESFGIRHESPQVLLISKGKCIYDASHLAISADKIEQFIDNKN